MSPTRAFTLIELIVVIALVAFFLCLLVIPPRHGAGRSSRSMQNNTQLRGIHQSLIIHSTTQRGYYPGLAADGTDAGLTVENRFQILLDGNYITGDYVVSPFENRPYWTGGPVTSAHYSFAMLQIPAAGGRREEWRETLNPDAIVLSDRNVGTTAHPRSIHNVNAATASGWSCSSSSRSIRPHGWAGGVVYNDNSVMIEMSPKLPTAYAVAGVLVRHPADQLFEAAGDDDALMIHSGN